MRVRQAVYVAILLAVAMIGGVFVLLNAVDIPAPSRELKFTSLVCTADVADGQCTPSNSVAQFSSGGSRVEVTLDEMSPYLIDAVVAGEDRDFFRHNGVDPWGITRAVVRDLMGSGSKQGGSTITQQYVKNVYLTQERTFTRKLREAAIAVKLERKLTKRQILERYLNEIFFGRRAYGVEAAAQAYFGVDASELTLAQSAYLAGLIRAPETADAKLAPAEATRRRKTVLVAMQQVGYISAEQAAASDKEPWDAKHLLDRPPATNGTQVRPQFKAIGGDYIAEWVRRQLNDIPGIGEDAVYNQGLRIYLTIDPTLQLAAHDAITHTLDRPDDPTAALVSVDDTGKVIAMVGGKGYQQSGSEVDFALGRQGGGGGRQAGSTFKPFALAAFVEQGNSVKSQVTGPLNLVIPKGDRGADWAVTNYNNEQFGVMTVEEATWHSVNTAYAQIMQTVGRSAVNDMAKKLGVSAPVPAYNSTVLGTADVSVLDMAQAYSTFANHGTLKPAHIIAKVEATDGSVIYDAAKDPKLAASPRLSPDVADTVSSVLTGVLKSGTATNAQIKQPAAGKTGTTDNNQNAWFVGYTCAVTASVWMGNDPVQNPMDNVHGKKVTGGTFPVDIWKRFMVEATKKYKGCPFRTVDVGTKVLPPNLETLVCPPIDPTTTTTTTTGPPPPPCQPYIPPAGSSTTTTTPPAGGPVTTTVVGASTTVPTTTRGPTVTAGTVPGH